MGRKSTLLVLASTYPRWQADPEPGFVHELAKRLTDRFRVIALVPSSPGSLGFERMEGVEVHRYRYGPRALETLVNNGGILANLRRSAWKWLLLPSFVLSLAWNAHRLVRQEGVEVVHAHWLIPQGLVAALLTLMPGRRPGFLVTSHGADLFALRGRILGRLKVWVANRASALSVVSAEMKNELVRLGVAGDRIDVQPMGVDLTERFTPPGVDHGPRSRTEILFVGRLVEKKGLRFLIEAMPAIIAANRSVQLSIVGFGPEEEERKAQVRALGLADHVTFAGPVDQAKLPSLYRRAAVFVAPFVEAVSGDREGLGLVVVEAAGCDCPVVVSDLRSTMDVFKDSPPAALVAQGDSKAIADAVIRVLASPPRTDDLRTSLGARFDWKVVADAYSRVLQRLGGQAPGS